MFKLLIGPAFIIALIAGVIAGLQYAKTNNKEESIRTFQQGCDLAFKVFKATAIATITVFIVLILALYYFFSK